MRRPTRVATVAVASLGLLITATTAAAHPTHKEGEGKAAGFDLVQEAISPGGVPQEPMSDLRCEDGLAGGLFPCHKVDVASFTPLKDLGDSIWANDVWGWTDPETGREYALAKLYEGTAFVDITDASNPVHLGVLPAATGGSGNIWGDIKTYGNHAYIGSEATDHGIQIFDLTRLRTAFTEQEWTQDGLIEVLGRAGTARQ